MHKSEVALDYEEERVLPRTRLSASWTPATYRAARQSLGDRRERVFYTGDIKTVDTLLQPGARVPKADVLTLKAPTERTHPDRKTMEKDFLAAVEETVDAGGCAIVPASPVGRTRRL